MTKVAAITCRVTLLIALTISILARAQNTDDAVRKLIRDWESEYSEHTNWRDRTSERHELKQRLLNFGTDGVPEVYKYLGEFDMEGDIPVAVFHTISANLAEIPGKEVDDAFVRLFFQRQQSSLDYIGRRHRAGMPLSIELSHDEFEFFVSRFENEGYLAALDLSLLSLNSVSQRSEPILKRLVDFLSTANRETINLHTARVYVVALGYIGPEAQPYIETAFADKNSDWMQIWRSLCLGQIGDRTQTVRLGEIVDDHSENTVIRLAALEAYVNAIGNEAKPLLTRIVADDSEKYLVPILPGTLDCMQDAHLYLKREARNHLKFRIHE